VLDVVSARVGVIGCVLDLVNLKPLFVNIFPKLKGHYSTRLNFKISVSMCGRWGRKRAACARSHWQLRTIALCAVCDDFYNPFRPNAPGVPSPVTVSSPFPSPQYAGTRTECSAAACPERTTAIGIAWARSTAPSTSRSISRHEWSTFSSSAGTTGERVSGRRCGTVARATECTVREANFVFLGF